MKKYVFFALVTFFNLSMYGQQDRQFTHYLFDRMSFNPAVTGFKGYCGTIVYRNQWDKVENAPNTTLINVQGNLQNLNSGSGKLGVGLSMHNDVIGYQRANMLTGNLAYHVETVYGVFSSGLGLGFINVGFDPDWVPPNVPAINDPTLAGITTKVAATGFDSNVGLYWAHRNIYAGVSATHLIPQQLAKVSYQVARHYYIMGGYSYEFGQKHLGRVYPASIKPGVLIKTDGVTAVFDLNTKVDVWVNRSNYFWGALTYRYSDAVCVMAGLGMGNFKVGYSFDIMTNQLSQHGRGSHELMLTYCVFPERKQQGFGNPWLLR